MGRFTKMTFGVGAWDAARGLPTPAGTSRKGQQAGEPRPYVINLVTSSEPIGHLPRRILNFEHLEVYQIAGWNRDRLLFRMRLGPIETDLLADAILAAVRHEYPDAAAVPAGDEDMRMFSSSPAVTASSRPAQTRTDTQERAPVGARVAPRTPATPGAADPRVPSAGLARLRDVAAEVLAGSAAVEGRKPVPSVPMAPIQPPMPMAGRYLAPGVAPTPRPSSVRPAGASLPLAPLPRSRSPAATPAAPRTVRTAAAPPPQVGRSAGPAGLRDSADVAAAATLPRSATGARKPPPAAVIVARPQIKPAPAPTTNRPPPAAKPLEVRPGPRPPVDSTQTVRTLTPPEQGDHQSPKIFVIQLAVSDEEIRAENVPNLAIFDEYRLYSARCLAQGTVVFALRLGFFSDEGAAAAVAGYLQSFFESATVVRVSHAERVRFAERRMKGRKDSGDTGEHTKIELSSAPEVRMTSLAALSAQASAASNAASLKSKAMRRRKLPRQ